MSTGRKIRMLLVVVILVLSVTLLVWGTGAMDRATRTLPVDPGGLQLPTPSGMHPGPARWV